MYIGVKLDWGNFYKELEKLENLDEAIEKNVLDNRRILEEIKEYAKKRWVTNFNLQGTLYGGWKKLSPQTEKGPRPLYQTGEMYQYLKTQAENAIMGDGKISWEFGNTSGGGERMMFHQNGTQNFSVNGGGFHVPKRTLVAFNDQDRRFVQNKILAETRKFVSIYL